MDKTTEKLIEEHKKQREIYNKAYALMSVEKQKEKALRTEVANAMAPFHVGDKVLAVRTSRVYRIVEVDFIGCFISYRNDSFKYCAKRIKKDGTESEKISELYGKIQPVTEN